MPNHTPETPPSTQRVSEGASRLTQRAENVADKAHSAAVERVQQARSKAEANLDQRRQEAAERIKRVGGVFKSGVEQLRSEDQNDVIANYVERAGDALDRVASYVATTDLQDIARDAERFARQRPSLFYGGAFLLGLAAGRFLKSSASAGQFSEPAYDSDPLAPSTESQSSFSDYDLLPRGTETGPGTSRGNL
jgi:hypothetical protein